MFRGTTIVAVTGDEEVAVAGDGQVTMADKLILKRGARKVRRLYGGKILAGFAGSLADAVTLFDKFEGKIEQYHGNLQRAAVELAKEWRTDRILRRLEALLVVADAGGVLVVSGAGEVIEPDDGIVAVGSGAGYALSAARVLQRHSSLSPEQIARESLLAAAEICVYTNDSIIVETMKRTRT
ncbi:MAG: ATP-dependent protease subunit HslV [Bacillota bacterium]